MNAILNLVRATYRFDTLITEWGGSLMSLAIRLYVGSVFFQSGLVKIADWDSTVSLFTDEYKTPLLSPEVAAVMGTMGELSLPVLLFVGLLSRPAAFGLFMVTFDCPAAINDHRYWGILLLVLLAFGPGKLSLDALIKRRSA
jgi:putative oxidoreductase